MTAGGELFPLMLSEPRTSETAGSCLLPTPTASNAGTNRSPGSSNVRPSLHHMARHNLWPTPTVHGNYQNKRQGGSQLIGLATAVRLWPTPLARDWKYPGGNRKTIPLSGLSGGPLNPLWVELLMGLPVGWTCIKPLFNGWLKG
jgi:hypothetical protein